MDLIPILLQKIQALEKLIYRWSSDHSFRIERIKEIRTNLEADVNKRDDILKNIKESKTY
jgi:hypothetical protein